MHRSQRQLALVMLSVASHLLIVENATAYRWPFNDGIVPHRISATIGEYRKGPPPHLHNGVDMTPNGGAVTGPDATKIYAIDACASSQVSNKDQYLETITCGRFSYVHVKALIPNFKSVSAGEMIAELKLLDYGKSPHLHLIEDNGVSNPLRSGGLNNFRDTSNPSVEKVEFVRQGTSNVFRSEGGIPILDGMVDIRVKAHDSMSNDGSQKVGVYRNGYKVIQISSGQTVVPEVFKTTFDGIEPTWSYWLIYDNNISDDSTYYYWSTNEPTSNQYWDTNTASVPDGSYQVVAIVEDISGNRAIKPQDVIVRNGCSVSVGQGSPSADISNKFVAAYNIDGISVLGCPTGTVTSFSNSYYSPSITGYYQSFQGTWSPAEINYVPGYKAASVKYGFYQTFKTTDYGISGYYPGTGEQVSKLLVGPYDIEKHSPSTSVSGTDYTWQPFIKGSLYYFNSSPIQGGAFNGMFSFVWGDLSSRYEREGGRQGPMGLPFFDELHYGSSGGWDWWFQWFEKGLLWYGTLGAEKWSYAYTYLGNNIFENGSWNKLGWCNHTIGSLSCYPPSMLTGVDLAPALSLTTSPPPPPQIVPFQPPMTSAPTVVTLSATSITATGAILNGTVNPNGKPTTGWFEWGIASVSENATAGIDLGDGITQTLIHWDLQPLIARTTYLFRVVASNQNGTTYGEVFSCYIPGVTGTLIVLTNPVNGNIQVDGLTVGNGRSEGQVSTGRHTVGFESVDGYLTPVVRETDVFEGQTSTVVGYYTEMVTGVQVLAAEQTSPRNIAIDAENVYWTECDDIDCNTGKIRKAPLSGGTSVDLAIGVPYPDGGLALDSNYVYFAESYPQVGMSNIQRVPKKGGGYASLTLFQPSVIDIVTDGNYIYWTDLVEGTIKKVATNAGAVSVLSTNNVNPFGIAADNESVYWTELDLNGSVLKTSHYGGMTYLLASRSATIGIAVNQSYVYWAEYLQSNAGKIRRVSVNQGDSITIADYLTNPWDIAVDDDNVFWVENIPGGGIRQVPVYGGAIDTIAAASGTPGRICIDDKYIYWTESGSSGLGSGTVKRAIKKVGQVGTPDYLYVPSSSSSPDYQISWSASGTIDAHYVVEEATNNNFSLELRQVYSGSGLSIKIFGRSSDTTYYYRVKTLRLGYKDSDWRIASTGCTVEMVCSAPSVIMVPDSSRTRNYMVSWSASDTQGATYSLEEATSYDFSEGLRLAYSGSATEVNINDRVSGITYFYRVKTSKTGYIDSAWVVGTIGCAVGIPVFYDNFSDAFEAGDPDWVSLAGTWNEFSLINGNKVFQSSFDSNSFSVVQGLNMIDGKIEARLLENSAIKNRNVKFVFNVKDMSHYRYASISEGGGDIWYLSLGQAGNMDDESGGIKTIISLKGFPFDKWNFIRISIYNDGRVIAALDYSGGTVVSEFKYGMNTGGQVGLLAKYTRALVDNYTVWSGSALQ